MTSIVLIVDPSAFCREVLTALVEAHGHKAVGAPPEQALSVLRAVKPSIVVLEAGGKGFATLELVRADPSGKELPVVILTELSSRAAVVRARELGVRDFMLKSCFTNAELLSRLQKYLAPAATMARQAQAPAPQTPAKSPTPARPQTSADDDRRVITEAAEISGMPLLTRDRMLRRIGSVKMKALPSVVSEVISMVSSPRGSVGDLAQILKRDPLLAARVLKMSNSAAFITDRSRISTVEDAVRQIGLSGVRNLVMSVGVFESVTAGIGAVEGVARTLQHSLAVAALMEQITPVTDASPAGIAYVVGLCHDLADLILRQYFCEEYARVQELVAKTGRPQRQAESVVFGMPYNELATALLVRMGLPPVITAPIEEFFERGVRKQASGAGSAVGRALRLANVYAHGLMLAANVEEPVTPLTLEECRNTFGDAQPALDNDALRSDALMAAGVLVGSAGPETAGAFEPLIPSQPLHLCYIRDATYSELDPLHSILRLAAREVTVRAHDASDTNLAGIGALVVAAPRVGDAAAVKADLEKTAALAGDLPTLYLCGLGADEAGSCPKNVTVQRLPTTIGSIGEFLARCHGDAAVKHL